MLTLLVDLNSSICLRSPNAKASSPPPPPPTPPASRANNRKITIVACSAVTVALAIANRVLYKLALVPMKEFPFFLAQLTTFGYVVIYFSVLYMRYRAGIATDEMLASPKFPFIIIGFLEALGVVSGMYSGAMLPGPAIPILNQRICGICMPLTRGVRELSQVGHKVLVPWTTRSSFGSGEHDQLLSGVGIVWPALMLASNAFQAVASVVKESVFLDAATRLKGKVLDIFVVNSFGSGFQALFVLLCLPLLSNLKGCDGAPMLPLLYIITNIAFNISVLNLLKYSSAVVSSLAVMSSAYCGWLWQEDSLTLKALDERPVLIKFKHQLWHFYPAEFCTTSGTFMYLGVRRNCR
ncbi:UNVERIFIED_CONTAM: protein CLT2, chloroplastic [Sesamum latifolium]|uniref:Protein CLT2, chloroplastic n=1 Tax=Sesamum latifolium TaxID=2727402 RepID=A0AAW2VTA1_9LAMI